MNSFSTGLPQIFIGETFIGGYDSLKKLKKFKKLSPMILDAMGFNTVPCKMCQNDHQDSLHSSVETSRKMHGKARLRAQMYPGHA